VPGVEVEGAVLECNQLVALLARRNHLTAGALIVERDDVGRLVQAQYEEVVLQRVAADAQQAVRTGRRLWWRCGEGLVAERRQAAHADEHGDTSLVASNLLQRQRAAVRAGQRRQRRAGGYGHGGGILSRERRWVEDNQRGPRGADAGGQRVESGVTHGLAARDDVVELYARVGVDLPDG